MSITCGHRAQDLCSLESSVTLANTFKLSGLPTQQSRESGLDTIPYSKSQILWIKQKSSPIRHANTKSLREEWPSEELHACGNAGLFKVLALSGVWAWSWRVNWSVKYQGKQFPQWVFGISNNFPAKQRETNTKKKPTTRCHPHKKQMGRWLLFRWINMVFVCFVCLLFKKVNFTKGKGLSNFHYIVELQLRASLSSSQYLKGKLCSQNEHETNTLNCYCNKVHIFGYNLTEEKLCTNIKCVQWCKVWNKQFICKMMFLSVYCWMFI